MTRRVALAIFSVAILSTGQAAAADEGSIAADAQVLVPFGEFAKSSAPMIGPLLRIGYRMLPQLEIGVRGGYLFGLDRQPGQGENITTNFSILPVWLGVRYFVLEPGTSLYGAAEVGANFGTRRARGTFDGQSVNSERGNQGRLGVNLGVGYVISRAVPIDLRAQLSYLNLVGRENWEKASLALGFSAGYTATF